MDGASQYALIDGESQESPTKQKHILGQRKTENKKHGLNCLERNLGDDLLHVTIGCYF